MDGHPDTLLAALREQTVALLRLGDGPVPADVSAACTASLATLRRLVQDGPRPALVQRLLARGPAEEGSLLSLVVATLGAQSFEARKDTEAVVTDLLARFPEAAGAFTESVLRGLCRAYALCEHGALALNSGNILRHAVQHESVLRLLLNFFPNEGQTHQQHPQQQQQRQASVEELFQHSLFASFFTYVDAVDFEVSSDALWSFKEVLTANPALAADFLDSRFDPFFTEYNKLLQPQHNYVTRRQSLKILAELLLAKPNFNVMKRFTQSTTYLKSIMVLLKDTSAHIKVEAFHVFKLFVANPQKSEAVKQILAMNKEKLLQFFATFGDSTDLGLQEERNVLIMELRKLQPSISAQPPIDQTVQQQQQPPPPQHGYSPQQTQQNGFAPHYSQQQQQQQQPLPYHPVGAS